LLPLPDEPPFKYLHWRKVIIKQSVADRIAEIAWFIESKGLVLTAERFSDAACDFIEKLADSRRDHAIWREPERAFLDINAFPIKKIHNYISGIR
jgi:hypothetical protein